MNSKFIDISNKIFQNRDKVKNELKDCELLIIHHILPTHLVFFFELLEIFNKTTFLAIPYSVNLSAVNELHNKKAVVIVPNSLSELDYELGKVIISYKNSNKKVIIIEVGGYSCHHLMSNPFINNNLLCVIEDTENGHRIYEKYYNDNIPQWPTFSVARSTLKISEDILTGDSIVFSIEKILRSLNEILVAKNVLVLGYGKIGRSVAVALASRKCKVSVYDINPIKSIEAFANGYNIDNIENLLANSEIIIGVSGATSINSNLFGYIKDGAILFSGSSKQVEFDINFLTSNCNIDDSSIDKLKKYIFPNNNFLYLANNGEPVNFIDKGIVGIFLELVWLEILSILTKIGLYKEYHLYELDETDRKKIATFWLESYSKGF